MNGQNEPIDFIQEELKELENSIGRTMEDEPEEQKTGTGTSISRYVTDLQDSKENKGGNYENKYDTEEENAFENDENPSSSDDDGSVISSEQHAGPNGSAGYTRVSKQRPEETSSQLKLGSSKRRRPDTIQQIVRRIKKKKTKDNPRDMAYKLLLTFLRNNFDEKRGREIFSMVKQLEKEQDKDYKRKYNFIINYITQLISLLRKNPNLEIKKSYLEDNPKYQYFKKQVSETKSNITDVKPQKSLVACKRCKSSENITKMTKQTRSADEPASIIITCGDCGYQWQGDF